MTLLSTRATARQRHSRKRRCTTRFCRMLCRLVSVSYCNLSILQPRKTDQLLQSGCSIVCPNQQWQELECPSNATRQSQKVAVTRLLDERTDEQCRHYTIKCCAWKDRHDRFLHLFRGISLRGLHPAHHLLGHFQICPHRYEVHGHAVQAVPLPGGTRTVVKYVSQMTAARPAVHLGSGHDQLVVHVEFHGISVDGCVEGWPSGAGIEFRGRDEEGRPAAGAPEHAVLLDVVERRRVGRLRPLLPQHPVGVGGQHLPPFLVRLFYFRTRHRSEGALMLLPLGGKWCRGAR
mmetsp:Transcript_32617/g.96137  ORF Transcript_32617/g.96137 Transcript_32617/m.96137 type:complete len:290 (-) Transcript_32617:104-973(-)